MFDLLGSLVDGVYKIFWLIIALYMLASGGIGYLIRLFSNPFKVDFTDSVIKKLDNEILDLQLLRLYHGINVLNKKDAQLVSKAMDKGILSEKDFLFLYFAPPIGKSKHGKKEIAIFTSTLALFFISLIIAFNSEAPYKYDYASYRMDNEKVLISEVYVFNPIEKEYINAKKCRNLAPSENQSIVASACSYLLTTDIHEKKELMTAIEKNNSNLIAALILLIMTTIISLYLILGYITYYNTNNKFIDFKNSEDNNNH